MKSIKKNKALILEHKYTNQMIDQMKMQYFKELHHNIKINNKSGIQDFDKMTQNLKSIPEEDCQEKVKIPSKGKLKMRINSAFGFAMSQFKSASSIKPIRSIKALSITERGGTNMSLKRKRIKGKSTTSQ